MNYYSVISNNLFYVEDNQGLIKSFNIDKKDVTREVYLFVNNDKLHEALEFYSKFRYNTISNNFGYTKTVYIK